MAEKTQEKKVRTGSCLCGTVKYELTAPPVNTCLCHCDNCAKVSGSPLSANWWFPKDSLRILNGSSSIRKYNAASITQPPSSPDAEGGERCFCANCGTHIYVHVLGVGALKDIVVIMSGTLDDRYEFAPQVEFFTKRRVSWLGDAPAGTKRLMEV